MKRNNDRMPLKKVFEGMTWDDILYKYVCYYYANETDRLTFLLNRFVMLVNCILFITNLSMGRYQIAIINLFCFLLVFIPGIILFIGHMRLIKTIELLDELYDEFKKKYFDEEEGE